MRRPRYSLALISLGLGLTATSALAVGPEPEPDTDAMFALERARRAQERDATAAAPYRSNLSWPVGAADADRNRWLVLSGGGGYDEQPETLAHGLAPPDEFADHGEGTGFWFGDVGYELFDTKWVDGGLAAAYFGQGWTNWDQTTHSPSLTTWLDFQLFETFAMRFRYDFGYSVLDNQGYATTHHVGPRFYKDWGDDGVTEIYGEYYDFDFHKGDPDPTFGNVNTLNPATGDLCRPVGNALSTACAPDVGKTQGERRDRSGWGFIFGGEHRVDFDWNNTELRAGYIYQHYIPDGAEFHNQSHELWAQVTTALPWEFVLETNVAFTYQGARNVPSFPDRDDLRANRVYGLPGYRRHDKIWRWYTAIGREITEHVSASVEYGFKHHESNFDGWDYARHQIGGVVTIHFE